MPNVNSAEIHFHEQEVISIFLTSNVSGNEELQGEIGLAVYHAIRILANLDVNETSDRLAHLLSVAPEIINGFVFQDATGGFELIEYPGHNGRYSFMPSFEWNDEQGKFDLDYVGFGLSGQGLGYYAPISVLALVRYLAMKRASDEPYLLALGYGLAMAGNYHLERTLNISNQSGIACASWAVALIQLDGQDEMSTIKPSPPPSQAATHCWFNCPGCEGEIGIPANASLSMVSCPNCGVSVEPCDDSEVLATRHGNDSTRYSAPRRQAASVATTQGAEIPARYDFNQGLRIGNGYATAGLILGILSVFLSFIGIIPIAALIVSSVGLSKANERCGAGKAQAMVGLVLGILYTFTYVFVHSELTKNL